MGPPSGSQEKDRWFQASRLWMSGVVSWGGGGARTTGFQRPQVSLGSPALCLPYCDN